MKTIKPINKNTLFVIFILSLALGIGIWRNHHLSTNQQKTANIINHSPKSLPAFQLTEVISDKLFTEQNLHQKWSFLFFGYSSCPDVCPKTIGTLNQIATALRHHSGVQYLFISIHPEKDTPEILKTFLTQDKFQAPNHSSHIIQGLTGDKKQILHLAKQIGIFIDENPSQPALSGPIEHSGTLVLINPKGELAAVFSNSDSPTQIAQDFQKHYQQAAKFGRAKPAVPS